jgi:pilus assembly protein Flp/PilA
MLEMIKTYVRSLRDDEEGQALVEYSLIVALISVVAIAALTAIGTSVNDILTAVGDALDAVPLPGA